MFRYKIDKVQEIIFTRATGTPTTVTMIDHIRNVMKNIRIAGIPKYEIEIVRQVLNGYAQQGKGRNCAVVVPNERQEIFLKLNLELIHPIKFNIRAFYSEYEALKWIKSQQPQQQNHRDHGRTPGVSAKPPHGVSFNSNDLKQTL